MADDNLAELGCNVDLCDGDNNEKYLFVIGEDGFPIEIENCFVTFLGSKSHSRMIEGESFDEISNGKNIKTYLLSDVLAQWNKSRKNKRDKKKQENNK